jgi:hypothetical protein
MSNVATKGSLAERYSLVLQELRLEVLRHNHCLVSQDPNDMELLSQDIPSIQRQPSDDLQQTSILPNHNLVFPMETTSRDPLDQSYQISAAMIAGESPNSMLAQYVSWGQFESLVSKDNHTTTIIFFETQDKQQLIIWQVSGGAGHFESLIPDDIDLWNFGPV